MPRTHLIGPSINSSLNCCGRSNQPIIELWCNKQLDWLLSQRKTIEPIGIAVLSNISELCQAFVFQLMEPRVSWVWASPFANKMKAWQSFCYGLSSSKQNMTRKSWKCMESSGPQHPSKIYYFPLAWWFKTKTPSDHTASWRDLDTIHASWAWWECWICRLILCFLSFQCTVEWVRPLLFKSMQKCENRLSCGKLQTTPFKMWHI